MFAGYKSEKSTEAKHMLPKKGKLSADSQPLYCSGKQGGTVLYAYIEMKTGSQQISVCVEIFWNVTAFSRATVHSPSQLHSFGLFLPLPETFQSSLSTQE